MSNNKWCAMCGKWTDHQSGTCPELSSVAAPTEQQGREARCAGSSGSALKAQISDLLMNTLNGQDKTLRTKDGYIRWGLVEERIHALVDAAMPNTADEPRAPTE